MNIIVEHKYSTSNADNRRLQSLHFDEKAPFVPGAWILRGSGFEFQYILKDVLIANTIASIELDPDARVLDLGSGEGILLDRICNSRQAHGFGVDISFKSLRRSISEGLSGIKASMADARSLPFADQSFDLVVSMDVLEHIERPERALQEISRVIRPGGAVLFYAVSHNNRYTFNWFLMGILEILHIDHWSWAAHSPELLIDPVKTREWLAALGWRIQLFRPFHAFFTIIYDQAALSLYWIASKAGVFRFGSPLRNSFATAILYGASRVGNLIFSIINRLDTPWTSRELANGFLVLAIKE